MSAAETKQRILDAAERLFAEKGFDATSLRSVTAAAGANLAAVNYHFGSKAALLPAVVARIVEPVNRLQLQRLDELEARADPPSVEELLEAFVVPVADFFAQDAARAPMLASLFARIMGDPGEDMRRAVIERVRETEGRYEAAFARALPDLPPAELWVRLRSVRPVVGATQLNLRLPPALGGPPADTVPDRDALLRSTLAFLSAGMRAPAAGDLPPRVSAETVGSAG
jgi:AcrR family transcriptional regulator